jgi:hypothetical protein
VNIDKRFLYEALNQGIAEERFASFRTNLKKNLPFIKKHGGLKNIVKDLTGKNIIVIGAGPSLDSDYATLKKYQNRVEFKYIATDMALKPLVSNGINPSYVISCESTPTDYFGGINTSQMHLIAFSCISNSNLRRWNGSMSFYNWMINDDIYNDLWKLIDDDIGYLATGVIVTTQAVSLTLGCSPASICLVGNDLAFSSRFYAKGSVRHSEFYVKSSRLSTIDSYDINSSRKTRDYEICRDSRLWFANHQFMAARLWLEELIANNNFEICDASIPGLSPVSVKKISLKEYTSDIDKYNRKSRSGRKK